MIHDDDAIMRNDKPAGPLWPCLGLVVSIGMAFSSACHLFLNHRHIRFNP